ncbi:MAG: hypothetical protein AAFU61_04695 [Pseudomonadota bacterium]
MTDPRIISRDKLQSLIDETESSLAELKEEMERREDADQHREIDRLEEHLASAENGLRSVRDFFRMLVEDFRK